MGHSNLNIISDKHFKSKSLKDFLFEQFSIADIRTFLKMGHSPKKYLF